MDAQPRDKRHQQAMYVECSKHRAQDRPIVGQQQDCRQAKGDAQPRGQERNACVMAGQLQHERLGGSRSLHPAFQGLRHQFPRLVRAATARQGFLE